MIALSKARSSELPDEAALVEKLSRCPALAALPWPRLRAAARASQEIAYGAGEAIPMAADRLYISQEGRVALHLWLCPGSRCGGTATVVVVRSGHIFGWRPIAKEERPEVRAVPSDQVIPVLEELAPRLTSGHLVVSVAAAVPLAPMERVVGEGVPVAWVLPTSPSLIGHGITPAAYGRAVTLQARALAEKLLACWGEAVEVPEDKMNLCMGLAAAAPTYIFPVIAALTQAGVRGGLTRDLALRLAASVVQGSGALVLETGQSPVALAGLTPLQTMREVEVKEMFIEAVEKATASAERLQARLRL